LKSITIFHIVSHELFLLNPEKYKQMGKTFFFRHKQMRHEVNETFGTKEYGITLHKVFSILVQRESFNV
jgi:hypothetical protein